MGLVGVDTETREEVSEVGDVPLEDHPGQGAIGSAKRAGGGEGPFGGFWPERFMVDVAQYPAADPAHVLILNEDAATGDEATVEFAEEGFGVGDVMEHIPHADEADGVVWERHAGAIDGGIDALVGEDIGCHHAGDDLFDEAGAGTEFYGEPYGRGLVQRGLVAGVDFFVE